MMGETVLNSGVLFRRESEIRYKPFYPAQNPTADYLSRLQKQSSLAKPRQRKPFGRCNHEKIILSLARLNTSDLTRYTTLSRYHPTQRRQCNTRASDWF